jgi:hypothetical protein
MVTLNNQKRLIQEKYEEDLLYFYKGSQFTVSRELITFVGAMLEREQETLVITDDNGIPASVDDIEDFYDSIVDVYFSASNSYYAKYEALKKNRSVEKLVEYEEE